MVSDRESELRELKSHRSTPSSSLQGCHLLENLENPGKWREIQWFGIVREWKNELSLPRRRNQAEIDVEIMLKSGTSFFLDLELTQNRCRNLVELQSMKTFSLDPFLVEMLANRCRNIT